MELTMEKRFHMNEVQPDAFRVMRELSKYVAGTGIPHLQQELIKIRASQINGCAINAWNRIMVSLQTEPE